jgi:NADH-quinone oxidoreductase subunit M
MLLAIMAMYWHAGTTDIRAAGAQDFPASMQTWLWLAFFASFAVKMPMWPVHTWLPDAHVEAPTAGSVILAGILLKWADTASCGSRCRCSRWPPRCSRR